MHSAFSSLSSTCKQVARPLPCRQRPLHKAHGCMQPLHSRQRRHAARAFRDPSSTGINSGGSSGSSMPGAPSTGQGAAAALGSYIRDAARNHASNQQKARPPATGNGISTAHQAAGLQQGSTSTAPGVASQDGGSSNASDSSSNNSGAGGGNGCRAAFVTIDELKATDPATGTTKCHLYTGGAAQGCGGMNLVCQMHWGAGGSHIKGP
jgi:hypothetical protein